jgi:hypothetical protein
MRIFQGLPTIFEMYHFKLMFFKEAPIELEMLKTMENWWGLKARVVSKTEKTDHLGARKLLPII